MSPERLQGSLSVVPPGESGKDFAAAANRTLIQYTSAISRAIENIRSSSGRDELVDPAVSQDKGSSLSQYQSTAPEVAAFKGPRTYRTAQRRFEL